VDEVDPEFGIVRVLRYVIAANVGNVIESAIVHGQFAGGAVRESALEESA
jgi:CO/xanthine dehydrogenase Mo-binding subunit